MSKIGSIANKAWSLIVWAFEKADIIPALVIISAWHYGGAMQRHGDPLPVAVALGVLTDVGHYRSVQSVARKSHEPRRWIVMIVLTVLTWYYHFLWYDNFVLSICIPALIVSLALLSHWDGWGRQAAKFVQPVRRTETNETNAVRTPLNETTNGTNEPLFRCAVPGCAWMSDNERDANAQQRQAAGHKSGHARRNQ